MKVNRVALREHVAKVSCGGLIEGAVFRDGFQTSAMSEDQLLIALIPNLNGAESLGEEPVGIPYLSILTNALGVLHLDVEGEVPKEIDVAVKGHHLAFDEEAAGEVRLHLSAARTIASNISPENVAEVAANLPDGAGVPLTPNLRTRIQNTFAALKAREVELFVGPKGGSVRVGNEDGNLADFPAPDLKASETYSLVFRKHLVAVLGVLTQDDATLVLDGPDRPVLVRDGDYRYVLAAHSRGADA